MTILKGFSPSNTVTSYSGSTIGSGYYSNPITPREFDNRNFGKPTEDYDEFFKKADKHIARKRIKETSEVPPVEEKFRKFAVAVSDAPQPTHFLHDTVKDNPEVLKRENKSLIYDALTQVTGLPADLLPLHDAIFPKDEEVQDAELRTPVHEKFWWDHDVIEDEFRHKPGMWATIDEKVEYYFNRKEKDEQTD